MKTNLPPLHHHRGFTLIETVAASIIGAVVLLGCFSVFAATGRMDQAFGDRFDRTNDLHITQMVMRNAFLKLQMEESQSGRVVREDDEDAPPPDEPRDRLLLELDPSAGQAADGWTPQRFELVLSTPPIAMNLATQSAGWLRMLEQDGSLDFSSPDGSGGALRSVFELRRTNTREDVMLRTGLIDVAAYASMTGRDPISKDGTLQAVEPAEGWTLWWRPVFTGEAESLQLGYPPFADSQGSTDEIRTRLSGAIAIARGIDRARWQLYKGDEMIDEYSGSILTDLPAYAAFEIMMLNGQYATWMFEVDWIVGDEPTDDGDEDSEDDDGGTGEGGTNNTDGGNGEPPTRPGGGGRPNDNVFDIGNQS